MSTLIAITNPSDKSAEASIVREFSRPQEPQNILENFGHHLEDGAQVVMVNHGDGFRLQVWQYVATRDEDSIALRPNNALAANLHGTDAGFIDFINEGGWDIIAVEDIPLGEPMPLNTYTVFGVNDDDERFTAVVTARSDEAAYDAGVAAGLVDEGYEDDVRIDVILKGDHADIENVRVPDPAEG